jgi:hypothetical protein
MANPEITVSFTDCTVDTAQSEALDTLTLTHQSKKLYLSNWGFSDDNCYLTNPRNKK